MRRAPVALFVCFLLAAVLQAAPATAESGHRGKDVGDAPAAIDITAIDASNAQRRVRIVLTVPGLSHQGKFTFTYESSRYDGMALVVRERGGAVTWQAFHCGEESCAKVRCPRVKVTWSVPRHFVRASVPQSCYPLEVPKAWSFNGHSDLGDDYDSTYTKLTLDRG